MNNKVSRPPKIFPVKEAGYIRRRSAFVVRRSCVCDGMYLTKTLIFITNGGLQKTAGTAMLAKKGWHAWKHDQLNSGRGACAAPASAMKSATAGCSMSGSMAAATATVRGWPSCLKACPQLRLKSAFAALPVKASPHPALINWLALCSAHHRRARETPYNIKGHT